MKKRTLRLSAVLICLLVLVITLVNCGGNDTTAYKTKSELLSSEILTETTEWELGLKPAGEVGFSVFLSVCDSLERAEVFCGTGDSLEDAWKNADKAAEKALKKSGLEPLWVKADLVYITVDTSYSQLCSALSTSQYGSAHYGIAFDSEFETALLEAELNSTGIYRYGENGGIDKDALNDYLKESGRKKLRSIPDDLTVFQCFSWLCDEDSSVYMLGSNGLRTGELDSAQAQKTVSAASAYLAKQVKEDGSFAYSYSPISGKYTENSSMLSHASALRALILGGGDRDAIDRAAEYMAGKAVYKDSETAFILDESSGEILLGSSAMAVAALSEYMDAFQTDKYSDLCRKLGNGILSLMDTEQCTFCHVLNSDFSVKEQLRSISFDGMAAFALCRLYGLTGEQQWLNVACAAADHFIDAGYVQYCDVWTEYCMNELTKYLDSTEYYIFALENVRDNYDTINSRSSPTDLELLMSAFEMYERLIAQDMVISGFDREEFFSVISSLSDSLLSNCFYPEYAMYMEAPELVLGAFMTKENDFAINIDNMQHHISAYHLYLQNYDRLLELKQNN